MLSACDVTPDPYLKHDMKWEKIAGDCNSLDPNLGVVSNIIGERYEFQICLEANYKGEYRVERRGDTVDVRFHRAGISVESLYKITLDINTHPRYNFLSIDGSTFVIVARGK